jgi:hypothetical protein
MPTNQAHEQWVLPPSTPQSHKRRRLRSDPYVVVMVGLLLFAGLIGLVIIVLILLYAMGVRFGAPVP